MQKNASKVAMLALLAAAFGGGEPDSFYDYVSIPKKPYYPEKNGLKQFSFTGGTVWAINKKNALRKAKKLGYEV